MPETDCGTAALVVAAAAVGRSRRGTGGAARRRGLHPHGRRRGRRRLGRDDGRVERPRGVDRGGHDRRGVQHGARRRGQRGGVHSGQSPGLTAGGGAGGRAEHRDDESRRSDDDSGTASDGSHLVRGSRSELGQWRRRTARRTMAGASGAHGHALPLLMPTRSAVGFGWENTRPCPRSRSVLRLHPKDTELPVPAIGSPAPAGGFGADLVAAAGLGVPLEGFPGGGFRGSRSNVQDACPRLSRSGHERSGSCWTPVLHRGADRRRDLQRRRSQPWERAHKSPAGPWRRSRPTDP